ncbi:Mog1p/PsbP-like protein [Dothidotthia symphoricarpi CBS 119687]|uniref:Mog1p/PsbP-like protein n=1 Tax=Dothidotthia symphoricarpi CBS 119687 TaxID=1392245 RepID=A0A6A6AEL5_9PLEO|nr:Mog1p/PsbP-like protein [Dothidotthia symphoricarpi CBS 119687]KAF2130006.1 Mog1p/PsbP-like protein [Dothidotthia symphoricarpi CBS 119687]
MAFTNTPLFGGAITVDLPSNFGDASQIRQIPDHQEVYLDNDGYSSIVVEILEYVRKPSDGEALQHHFADLVDGTGDHTNILVQSDEAMAKVPGKPVLALTFIQTPQPEPRRKIPEFVYVHLFLLRLKEKATDMMVSINVPHYAGEYEKAQNGGETKLMKDSATVRSQILQSFEIKDWGLFDG